MNDLKTKAKDVLLLVEVAKTLLESLTGIKIVNALKSFVPAKLFLGDVLRIEVKGTLNLFEIAMAVFVDEKKEKGFPVAKTLLVEGLEKGRC